MRNGYENPEICEETGKMSYDKKGAISQINRLRKTRGEELRVYPCDSCSGWHISHQSFGDYRVKWKRK